MFKSELFPSLNKVHKIIILKEYIAQFLLNQKNEIKADQLTFNIPCAEITLERKK